jgi:hypothetical protein
MALDKAERLHEEGQLRGPQYASLRSAREDLANSF